ncbi:oligosaccharide flippase family protein [Candidatus Margulisiibacteriota bacterium]
MISLYNSFKSKVLSKIRPLSTLNNIATLFFGNIIGQVIVVGAMPFLSRIYSPEQFGVFGTIAAITMVISAIASLRYEMAIVLPGKDKEALNLFVLSNILIAIFSVIVYATIVLCKPFIIAYFSQGAIIYPYLWFIPFAVLFSGFFRIANYWLTHRSDFKLLSRLLILKSIIMVMFQVIAGLNGLGASGLIMGQICGFLGIGVLFLFSFFRKEGKIIARSIHINKIKQVAREYHFFPKYSSLQVLFNTLSQNIPIFFFAFFYGPKAAGFYLLAYKLLNLPVFLVSQSVRQVIYKKTADTHNIQGNVHLLLKKSTLYLAVAVIIPTLIVMIWGIDIFKLVLGEQWAISGAYSRILAFWLFFAFVNPPAVMAYQVFSLQRILLVFEVILLVLRAGAFIFGGKYLDPIATVTLYTAVGILWNIFIITYMLFYSKMKAKQKL